METVNTQFSEKRLGWVDVFKGIAIILIVVGHATKIFNQFIYQFHVAAFFFISGYTYKFERKTFGNILVSRFYKLMVPYYTINLCGITLFYILNLFGLLPYISTVVYPSNYLQALWALFWGNTVYCDWLGAMWFMPVLFKATLISKAIQCLCKRKPLILLMSFIVYFFSHQQALMKLNDYQWSLAGIAQLLIICGWLLSSFNVETIQWGKCIAISALLVFGWNISIKHITNNTVNWPSKNFNSWLIDLYLPIYGIALCLFISLFLVQNRYVYAILSYIGKNSMAIMCFHFIGFKIAELLLIPIHLYQLEMLYTLTPSGSYDVWYILVPISIVFSLVVWKVINLFSVSSVCVGNYSTKKLIDRIKKSKWGEAFLYNGYLFIEQLIKNSICDYKYLFGKLKYKKIDFIVLCGTLIIGLGVVFSMHYGEICISYPDTHHIASYNSEWLPQSASENYRWIQNKAEMHIFLLAQKNINIQGFIPGNIDNATYFNVLINGKTVATIEVNGATAINVDLDANTSNLHFGNNSICFETDGLYNPQIDEVDQRVFSALINKIYFE